MHVTTDESIQSAMLGLEIENLKFLVWYRLFEQIRISSKFR